jgi:hypothetical protein
MLSRKLSNYLFYGSLIAIIAVVLLIRSVTLGGINEKIELLKTSNITLQQQNDALEAQVEEYKDIQINHLYELYGKVPNYYSQTDLTYYTIAQLESIGITEAVDFQRSVYVDTEITFGDESVFGLLSRDFKIVQVQVYFTTLDADKIEEFIDLLYNSEQVFILDSIEYTTPDGVNYIGVTVNFLAFYEIEEEIIEEAS